MPHPRTILRPRVEALDARVVLSSGAATAHLAAAATTVNPSPTTASPPRTASTGTGGESVPLVPLVSGKYPSANRFRAFTPADLQAYAAAYESFRGDPGYAPQYDFNGTGFIGQNDATPILRGLAGITPRVPLRLSLALAPGQQIVGHHPSISGGATRLPVVTVIGKTTPNSIIFTDGPTVSGNTSTGNFKFEGRALTSDANGVFSYSITLAALSKDSLTATAYLIRTPFGQQTIRAFPIFRVG